MVIGKFGYVRYAIKEWRYKKNKVSCGGIGFTIMGIGVLTIGLWPCSIWFIGLLAIGHWSFNNWPLEFQIWYTRTEGGKKMIDEYDYEKMV